MCIRDSPNIVPQYQFCKDKGRENVIINVARIDGVQKRQHLLIEAFAKLKNKYLDWRVEIWGETDMTTSIIINVRSY